MEDITFYDYLINENLDPIKLFGLQVASVEEIQRALDFDPNPLNRPTFINQEPNNINQVVPVMRDGDQVLVYSIYQPGEIWGNTQIPSCMYSDVPDPERMQVSSKILETTTISDDGVAHVISLHNDIYGRSLYIPREGYPFTDDQNRQTSQHLVQLFENPLEEVEEHREELDDELIEAYENYLTHILGDVDDGDDGQDGIEVFEPPPDAMHLSESVDVIEPDLGDPHRLKSVTPDFQCTQLRRGPKWAMNSCYFDNILFVMFHPDLRYYEDAILNLNLDWYYAHPDEPMSQKVMQNMCAENPLTDLKIKKEIQQLLRQDLLNLRRGTHQICLTRAGLAKCTQILFPTNVYAINDPVQDVLWPLTIAFGVPQPFQIYERVCYNYEERGWKKLEPKMIEEPTVILPIPNRSVMLSQL